MNAYEWGRERNSCTEALEWRRSLGDATQKTAWRQCQRGDWLIWQLQHGLTAEEFDDIRPALQRAVSVIVARAVKEHALHCQIPEVEAWAGKWLSGEDRTEASAASTQAAAGAAWALAAATAAAAAAEVLEAARTAAAKALWAVETEITTAMGEETWAEAATWAAARAAARAAEAATWAAARAVAARTATRTVEAEVEAEAERTVAGAWMPAMEKELQLQAQDIRREISKWPGAI